ncbi:MAG: tetratricopeptide repeat protein [Burkholderiales bacterium]|nr:tetratricopeptide repeat protein [Opitutaceae bacterium]
MPDTSSTPPLPPILAPESASAWRRLCLLLRVSTGRVLLVVRHDSPRLPRELPTILAAQSDRPLRQVVVNDTHPDPFAPTEFAIPQHAPNSNLPATLLSITGAEDLGLGENAARETQALYEFARRLDFRRDQFLPEGGVVLVWATERVFEALIQHAPNFLSLTTTIFTFRSHSDDTKLLSQPYTIDPKSNGILSSLHDLPPLPAYAPPALVASYDALAWLALAEQQYQRGREDALRGLATLDEHWEEIEAGWAWAASIAGLDPTRRDQLGIPRINPLDQSGGDNLRRIAIHLLEEYPDTGVTILKLRHNPDQSIRWCEGQAAAAQILGNKKNEAVALGSLAQAWQTVGKIAKATALHEKVLGMARELNERSLESAVLGSLGIIKNWVGRPREALQHHQQSLRISRETNNSQSIARDLNNIGLIHASLRQWDAALTCYREAHELLLSLGDLQSEAQLLGNLANLYSETGELAKAIPLYEKQITMSEKIGDKRSHAHALYNLAQTIWNTGRFQKATSLIELAINLAIEIRAPWREQAELVHKRWLHIMQELKRNQNRPSLP